MVKKEKIIPKYESVFNGNVQEKIEIAKKSKLNMKIREHFIIIDHVVCCLLSGPQ